MFGKPFSHPFLVLKTPCDHVVSEIHGSWKRGSTFETGIAKAFDKVTGRLRSERINSFMAAASGGYFPHCHAHLTCGEQQYRNALVEHTLFEGELPKARDLWLAMAAMIPALNDDAKPYYRYARRGDDFGNCQMMVRDMLDAIAPALQGGVPDLTLAQTGWTASPKTAIKLSL